MPSVAPQPDVEHHEVERPVECAIDRVFAVGCDAYDVTARLQELLVHLVVDDDQDALAFGRVTAGACGNPQRLPRARPLELHHSLLC
jgi:hypothetical protein